MSYKSKKRKKSKLNKLKFIIELILVKFFNKIKKKSKKLKKEEKPMKLFATRKVMEFLRARNTMIKSNNLRINQWVDEYLNRCLISGKLVNIVTQWCISKYLEERYRKQGNKFIPTKGEIRFFEKELSGIISIFLENGFRLNWWITFNRSYLDSGRIDRELENNYKKMIASLAERFSLSDNVLLLDWEDDVLGGRPMPNQKVLDNFEQYIRPGAFKIELKRHSKWAREEAALDQTDQELEKDVKFQIACEIEEGRFLTSEQSPFAFGEFILVPLESSERYDFFTVLADNFKNRIASIISYYPWRAK